MDNIFHIMTMLLTQSLCLSSASKDDLEEMETTEADGELQIITECWVEPQCGVIVNSSPKRQHFDGLDYRQLAEAVSEHFLLYGAVQVLRNAFFLDI